MSVGLPCLLAHTYVYVLVAYTRIIKYLRIRVQTVTLERQGLVDDRTRLQHRLRLTLQVLLVFVCEACRALKTVSVSVSCYVSLSDGPQSCVVLCFRVHCP